MKQFKSLGVTIEDKRLILSITKKDTNTKDISYTRAKEQINIMLLQKVLPTPTMFPYHKPQDKPYIGLWSELSFYPFRSLNLKHRLEINNMRIK